MSVKSEMSYRVVCDGCGEGPEDDGYVILHPSAEAAIDYALGGDWYPVGDDKHACDHCVSWDDEGAPVLLPANVRALLAGSAPDDAGSGS